jgi:carbon storage regulator
MLILTRKIGEMIRIGDDVTVRVLAVRGGQVSLGFTAPNDVRIFREEVLRNDAAAANGEAAPTTVREPINGERTLSAKVPAKLRPAPREAERKRSA